MFVVKLWNLFLNPIRFVSGENDLLQSPNLEDRSGRRSNLSRRKTPNVEMLNNVESSEISNEDVFDESSRNQEESILEEQVWFDKLKA